MCCGSLFRYESYATGDLVQFCTRLPALAGTHVLRAFERLSFHVPQAAAIRQQPTLFIVSDFWAVSHMLSINLYTCFKWLHVLIDGALSRSKLSDKLLGHMKISGDCQALRRSSNVILYHIIGG